MHFLTCFFHSTPSFREQSVPTCVALIHSYFCRVLQWRNDPRPMYRSVIKGHIHCIQVSTVITNSAIMHIFVSPGRYPGVDARARRACSAFSVRPTVFQSDCIPLLPLKYDAREKPSVGLPAHTSFWKAF